MVEASHIVARVWEIRCVRQVTDGASWIRRHADQVTLSHRRAGCFWTAAQPAVRVLSKLSKSSSQTRAGRHKRRILLSLQSIHSHMGRIQKVNNDFSFVSKVCAHSVSFHSTGQQTDVTVPDACEKKRENEGQQAASTLGSVWMGVIRGPLRSSPVATTSPACRRKCLHPLNALTRLRRRGVGPGLTLSVLRGQGPQGLSLWGCRRRLPGFGPPENADLRYSVRSTITGWARGADSSSGRLGMGKRACLL
ncbi:hypothetical protein BDP81DRAFT_69362 [Colletotrichum phormii]|uniref:Uncharacterized protein n=1 Tax=Colletotrichum phormii TaxID=359342 RepID=A0AAI9ZMI7_9PEZI|nr:uncharacterized protein BDP81DRAFT_69362 [Colletotrichum phormii]KAK1633663.1 hypothetical protein BDP81DRAFT_69362 [Colletotrichum phormii]